MSSPKPIEFFYDVSSPYTYLSSEVVEAECAKAGVPLVWRPFLLGGVFKGAGNVMPASVPAKATYMLADLHRWSSRYGVSFKFPSRFPLNTLNAMRVLTAAAPERRPALTHLLMRAYWMDDRDVSDPAELIHLLGEEGPALLARSQTPEVKDALRAATEEALTRGAFGAPTFFVGDAVFWGNDRLDFAIEEALR